MKSTYSWMVLFFCAHLFCLSPDARAQEPEGEPLVCREDAPEGEECGDPPAETEAVPDAAASIAVEPIPPPSRSAFELPGFLFAVHLGPFFSFGGLAGGGVDLDFQFKLHRNSYLSIEGGYMGGYQIAKERQDSLLTGVLAYRHYFPRAGRTAFSIMAGPAIGYYLTGPENDRQGYDWLSAGIRAAAYYHFFLGERTSIGVGAGFGIFHQFAEFHERAEDFTIMSPELRLSLTF